MSRKNPSVRYKITTGYPSYLHVYYVYARCLDDAHQIFANAMPQFGFNFTVSIDTNEWKTSLQDGRIAPGA